MDDPLPEGQGYPRRRVWIIGIWRDYKEQNLGIIFKSENQKVNPTMALAGRTGSGKTTLAKKMLSPIRI